MIAQGANAIVKSFPTPASAPSSPRSAPPPRTASRSSPGQQPLREEGADYVSYTDWDPVAGGEEMATWLFENMSGKATRSTSAARPETRSTRV